MATDVSLTSRENSAAKVWCALSSLVFSSSFTCTAVLWSDAVELVRSGSWTLLFFVFNKEICSLSVTVVTGVLLLSHTIIHVWKFSMGVLVVSVMMITAIRQAVAGVISSTIGGGMEALVFEWRPSPDSKLRSNLRHSMLVYFLVCLSGYIRVKGGERGGVETWKILFSCRYQ